MMLRKSCSLIGLLSACGGLLDPPRVAAVPLTVEFSGNLVWVDDPYAVLDGSIYEGSPGTPFQGGFRYDPDADAVDLAPSDPMHGVYAISYSVWLEVGSVSLIAGPYRMIVENDWPSHGDRLQIAATMFETNGILFDFLLITFQDLDSLIYDDTDVPESITFEDFDVSQFGLRFDGNYPGFGGLITQLTVTPEPASGAMFLLLGVLARHRRWAS